MKKQFLGSVADTNLLYCYEYFGLKKLVTKANNSYYFLKTGPLGSPLFNVIYLPEKIKFSEIEAIEKSFRQDQTPFCWWVDIDNIAEEVKTHWQSAKYNFFWRSFWLYDTISGS